MKKIRLILFSLIAAFSLAVPAMVHAEVIGGNSQAGSKIQEGACTTTGNTDSSCVNGDPQGSFTSVIKRIVDIFSIVVGAVSVVMIIIGGFRYIISGGDSGNVSSAKNTILYAIVGLVIVALAQIIVNFVINIVTRS